MTHEEVVRTYYDLVDRGEITDLLALFSDGVVYERQGTPIIDGKAALANFYTSDRVIASGSHTLEAVLSADDWVAVRGNFCGTLKTGEPVDLRFTDWYHFTDEQIDHRQSFFPGRAV